MINSVAQLGAYVTQRSRHVFPSDAIMLNIPITLDSLRPYFADTLAVAAHKLGISISCLKNKCRKLGISRWPSRKIQQINNQIQMIKDQPGMQTKMEDLKQQLQRIYDDIDAAAASAGDDSIVDKNSSPNRTLCDVATSTTQKCTVVDNGTETTQQHSHHTTSATLHHTTTTSSHNLDDDDAGQKKKHVCHDNRDKPPNHHHTSMCCRAMNGSPIKMRRKMFLPLRIVIRNGGSHDNNNLRGSVRSDVAKPMQMRRTLSPSCHLTVVHHTAAATTTTIHPDLVNVAATRRMATASTTVGMGHHCATINHPDRACIVGDTEILDFVPTKARHDNLDPCDSDDDASPLCDSTTLSNVQLPTSSIIPVRTSSLCPIIAHDVQPIPSSATSHHGITDAPLQHPSHRNHVATRQTTMAKTTLVRSSKTDMPWNDDDDDGLFNHDSVHGGLHKLSNPITVYNGMARDGSMSLPSATMMMDDTILSDCNDAKCTAATAALYDDTLQIAHMIVAAPDTRKMQSLSCGMDSGDNEDVDYCMDGDIGHATHHDGWNDEHTVASILCQMKSKGDDDTYSPFSILC